MKTWTLEDIRASIAELESDIALSVDDDPKTQRELEEFEAWCRYDIALSNYYAALAKVPEEKLRVFMYGNEIASITAALWEIHPCIALATGWESVGSDTPGGDRLDVLGEEGNVQFTDLHHGASDEQLHQIAQRQPLPLPPHHILDEKDYVVPGGNHPPKFVDAWNHVSKFMPEMAAKVKKVTTLTPDQSTRFAKQHGRHDMAIDSPGGHLVIGSPEGVTPGILWHELVHMHQHHRGDMGKAPYHDPSGYLTQHGRLMESEAHQRGNVQGEALVSRMKQLVPNG